MGRRTFTPETDPEALALIEDALRRRGMTRADLARALGVSRSRVSQMLSPKGDIGMNMLRRVLSACGLGLTLQATAVEFDSTPTPTGGAMSITVQTRESEDADQHHHLARPTSTTNGR